MGMRTEAMHQTMLVWMAANSEALRAGHGQVDVDHLLLALLVMDGDAAAALTGAGVGLGPAREALAAQERDDLRALGLGDDVASDPWVPPVPTHYEAQLLPWSPAAQAVGREYRRWRESDLWLLQCLVEEPQGPAARLLCRLGVDGAAVVQSAPRPAGRQSWSKATQVELSVTVAAAALWRTVTDPTRRPEWDQDAGAVEVIDERTFIVTPRLVVESTQNGRAGWMADKVVTYRVVEHTPGRFLEWELSYPRRPDQRPYLERQSIEVTPVDGGARLTMTASRSTSRLRLVRRVFDWTGRYELRVCAQALAQVS